MILSEFVRISILCVGVQRTCMFRMEMFEYIISVSMWKMHVNKYDKKKKDAHKCTAIDGRISSTNILRISIHTNDYYFGVCDSTASLLSLEHSSTKYTHSGRERERERAREKHLLYTIRLYLTLHFEQKWLCGTVTIVSTLKNARISRKHLRQTF